MSIKMVKPIFWMFMTKEELTEHKRGLAKLRYQSKYRKEYLKDKPIKYERTGIDPSLPSAEYQRKYLKLRYGIEVKRPHKSHEKTGLPKRLASEDYNAYMRIYMNIRNRDKKERMLRIKEENVKNK